MKHLGTKELKSGRLTLRRFTADDAEAMYKNWANDPEVTRYLTWEPHRDVSASQQILQSWVESYQRPAFYQWAIVTDKEPVGSIAVVNLDDPSESAEIGYCLSRMEWGKGIMSEALYLVIRFLFEEVGLHRIHAKHDTENIGSGRVMIKNGWRYEGLQKGAHRRVGGEWGDLALYAMLGQEWASSQAKPRNPEDKTT
jgi:RimJ/RimL family protein N-acetyltransferase